MATSKKNATASIAAEAPVEALAETPVETTAAPVENNAKPLDKEATQELIEKMQPYLAAYPDNKVFYITSDGQVFLEGNKIEADVHQKTLGGSLVVVNG